MRAAALSALLAVALLAPTAAAPEADYLAALAREAEREGVARQAAVYACEAAPPFRALAEHRGRVSLPSASLIKLPVMLAVYEAWSTDPRRPRRPQEEALVRRMIQESDNPATNVLVDFLGAPPRPAWQGTPGIRRVNEVLRRTLGEPEPVTVLATKLSAPGFAATNRAAAREIALLLARLAHREAEGDAAAADMLGVMRGTHAEHRDRIALGVPAPHRARVANKTGTLRRTVNDAAVVEGPKGARYALCIMLDGVVSEARAEALCRRLSAAAWQRFTRRRD